jgi:nucleotide-binding universal stress UspA family protein
MTWEFPTYYGWGPGWPGDLDFAADAKKVLDDEIETTLGSSTGVPISAVVVGGHPAPTLVERSKSASLIVVGNRGHGAFAGMLLGSVSEHLAAHARCPVVIVHDHADVDGTS